VVKLPIVTTMVPVAAVKLHTTALKLIKVTAKSSTNVVKLATLYHCSDVACHYTTVVKLPTAPLNLISVVAKSSSTIVKLPTLYC
jgi:hypothetical protein